MILRSNDILSYRKEQVSIHNSFISHCIISMLTYTLAIGRRRAAQHGDSLLLKWNVTAKRL